jgi:hypothetical protein
MPLFYCRVPYLYKHAKVLRQTHVIVSLALTSVTPYLCQLRIMRSVILFRVAFGLLAIDSVAASPCKPSVYNPTFNWTTSIKHY